MAGRNTIFYQEPDAVLVDAVYSSEDGGGLNPVRIEFSGWVLNRAALNPLTRYEYIKNRRNSRQGFWALPVAEWPPFAMSHR